MSLVVKYTESKPVPEAVYVCQLTKLEPFTHAEWGAGIKWIFNVVEPLEYKDRVINGMCSAKVSPKSKLYSWAQAFGVMLTPGEEFDLETLIGNTVRVRVKNKTSSRVVEGKSVEQTFSNVDAIAPYHPPATVAPKTAAKPALAAPADENGFTPPAGVEDADFNF